MNFEKLRVWKLSARLSAKLYKGLRELKDFGFHSQITRSGLSIPSNIAEGMSRFSYKDKRHFLVIAEAPVPSYEPKSILLLILDMSTSYQVESGYKILVMFQPCCMD